MNKIDLKLYVVGNELTDGGLISKMQRACEVAITSEYALEVIDVLTSPHLADAARVFVTPTLVRHGPPPTGRVIGDFSDPHMVLEKVGIPTNKAAE